MRRKLQFRALLSLGCLALGIASTRATVNAVDYWRMGENDLLAVPGLTTDLIGDFAGGRPLFLSSPLVYTVEVPAASAIHAQSTLSLLFTNSIYGSSQFASSLMDNFGVEIWVKPSVVSTNAVIFYNGDTTANGWGLFITNSTYVARFGGKVTFGSGSAAVNSWTHLALVRDSGVARLYVNGVSSSPATATSPNAATGSLAIGAPPQAPTNQFFTGLMDEARVFVFAAGQFSANDLLFKTNSNAMALSSPIFVFGPSGESNSLIFATNSPGNLSVGGFTWLHQRNNFSPTASNTIQFAIDANPGVTRSGVLQVGQFPGPFFTEASTTFIQAGSTYVPARLMTLVSSNLTSPRGLGVDAYGNLFIADGGPNPLLYWSSVTGLLSPLTTSNILAPTDVAVDQESAPYITSADGRIYRRSPVSGTVSSVAQFGPEPSALAVDRGDNVYAIDPTLVRVTPGGTKSNFFLPASQHRAVATDFAGNPYVTAAHVFFQLQGTNFYPIITDLNVTPDRVAVERTGNVFFSDSTTPQILKWSQALNTITPVITSGLAQVGGVAVDFAGNLYISDTGANSILELPNAYVDPTPRSEDPLGTTDSLPLVIPSIANLSGPLAPTSDQPWLTITSVTNGVVNFLVDTNLTGSNRLANITLLGVTIPISQAVITNNFILATNGFAESNAPGSDSVKMTAIPSFADWTATANVPWLHVLNTNGTGSTTINFTFDANPGATRSGTITIGNATLTVAQGDFYTLGTTSLVEYFAAGLDTVQIATKTNIGFWTASANAPWLHLAQTNHNSAGSVNVLFAFDDNFGEIRTGTLTIAGKTVTVTQPNINFFPAQPRITLTPKGSYAPVGLAVDNVGNVFIADLFNISVGGATIDKWNPTNAQVTAVVTGLDQPTGVAVDAAGNLYIADAGSQSIREWVAASNALITLVSDVGYPYGVAVDAESNVYYSDFLNATVNRWAPATKISTPLFNTDDAGPTGLSVDIGGNVYSGISGDEGPTNAVLQWTAVNSNTIALAADLGVGFPTTAVDGSGNVYITDPGNALIDRWAATAGSVGGLFDTAGVTSLDGIAVDFARNLYFVVNGSVQEIPRTFVDLSTRNVGAAAGTANLSPVYPTTVNLAGPFLPGTSQPWLTIQGITNGVITFAFTANLGPSTRTASLHVLGQTIQVNQGAGVTVPQLTDAKYLANGTFQFNFSDYPFGSYTVLSTTNLSMPLTNWDHLGVISNIASGVFQVTAPVTPDEPRRFFIIRSP